MLFLSFFNYPIYQFISFLLSEPAGLRVAADLLDGLAGKSELSAVRPFTNQSVSCATPMSVITASMIGVSMPSWSAMDAQQTRAMGNVLGEIAVVISFGPAMEVSAWQPCPMAYMGSQEVDGIHAGEILECVRGSCSRRPHRS